MTAKRAWIDRAAPRWLLRAMFGTWILVVSAVLLYYLFLAAVGVHWWLHQADESLCECKEVT